MGQENIIVAGSPRTAGIPDITVDADSVAASQTDEARTLASEIRGGRTDRGAAENRVAELDRASRGIAGPTGDVLRLAVGDAQSALRETPADYVGPTLTPRPTIPASPTPAALPNALAAPPHTQRSGRPSLPDLHLRAPVPDARQHSITHDHLEAAAPTVEHLTHDAIETLHAALTDHAVESALDAALHAVREGADPEGPTGLATSEAAQMFAPTTATAAAVIDGLGLVGAGVEVGEMLYAVYQGGAEGVANGLLSGLTSESRGWQVGTLGVLLGASEHELAAARAALPHAEREHFDEAVASALSARSFDEGGFDQACKTTQDAVREFQDGATAAFEGWHGTRDDATFRAGRASTERWMAAHPDDAVAARRAAQHAKQDGVADARARHVDEARAQRDAAYRSGVDDAVRTGQVRHFVAMRG